MSFEFLRPVDSNLVEKAASLHKSALGNQILFHSEEGMPDLSNVKMAIVGVIEDRRSQHPQDIPFHYNQVREEFYQLYSGNWNEQIADLGDIYPGESVDDTYFLLKSITEDLLNRSIIPIILGGSQDLAYAQYRAYDDYGQMVNLVNVDAKFDLGDTEQELCNKSYVGKMVVNEPYNLFNYANIGYQTYFNPQEEINLIEKLFFEAYRLGDISSDITLSEPVMRDANIVSLDVSSVAMPGVNPAMPNGFNGKEICALARYAGISDKVSSFGVYEIQDLHISKNSAMLVSQILWYFIEGVNFRKKEYNNSFLKEFTKFTVPLQDETLVFYRSELSGRWWVEIPNSKSFNNKLNKQSLLSCSHQDYLDACNHLIPERWYKACRKNEI
ncbi:MULTISPECIES: formimidoylglutamase [Mesonia]|uniref:Formimidoylglutamase n=1 Tax=Mesonia oceanica TaxID=2687242 RepID=A0AC61Y8I4_9FLAO|nr:MULTISPECIES: formimidoylglutamase [Mesonia]MAN27370.1 arginase [Mesonia sp.]MAQ40354.1 arginase [Mesonia sp.]MBJ97265.1 arginase [Flavobacteriaceae bacterium]VVV00787.1 Formimidoylglutamase [Mesonia oceanica]|tara:strand:- start:6404 stop:7558 length:1155 start_codon:yes stop_codon:yes gene_type:complete